jgi:hypothetical protein
MAGARDNLFPGVRYHLTDDERAVVAATRQEQPRALIDEAGPVPMIPVVQLYRRDLPWFIGPDDADLLQVLWCPFDHEPDYLPTFTVRWRRCAEVVDPVDTDALLPELVDESYLPNPCVLDPESTVDYPSSSELPPDLEERVVAWGKATMNDQGVAWARYNRLATAPVWKIGGTHCDGELGYYGPERFTCECGEQQRLLLTMSDLEWTWSDDSHWRPVEAEPGMYGDDTGPSIGTAKLHYCPVSFDHQCVMFSEGP